jgi:hypothetical protein
MPKKNKQYQNSQKSWLKSAVTRIEVTRVDEEVPCATLVAKLEGFPEVKLMLEMNWTNIPKSSIKVIFENSIECGNPPKQIAAVSVSGICSYQEMMHICSNMVENLNIHSFNFINIPQRFKGDLVI